MQNYDWSSVGRFANREEDLARLESWWSGSTRDSLALIGRRRVGKSWLFRRFAHHKPAVILVADELLPATQMARFSTQLEPLMGFRPQIDSVATLIKLLYQLGDERQILAVIDEFPLLLPEGGSRQRALTEIQAAMESHRDSSKTKLLICGSLIGQMQGLLAATSPLHGRIQPLDVQPLSFAEGREMSDPGDDPEQRIIRFAVAGGMARYLEELGSGGIKAAVCERVLDRRGALFNDPRVVLEQELRNPATYFSILEELAGGTAKTQHLANELQLDTGSLAPYLNTLREMRLIATSRPIGASAKSRNAKHRVSDGFVRFWFQFVFPNQDDLQTGLSPGDLWEADIAPQLAGFISPTFEELCVRYTRIIYGATAPRVGGWWGNSLNEHRRSHERSTEEVDVVAAQRKNLRIVGECKWTQVTMPMSVLDDLKRFKIPAIEQEKRLKIPADGPLILLFSRAGFSKPLIDAAERDQRLKLVDLATLVSGLDGGV